MIAGLSTDLKDWRFDREDRNAPYGIFVTATIGTTGDDLYSFEISNHGESAIDAAQQMKDYGFTPNVVDAALKLFNWSP